MQPKQNILQVLVYIPSSVNRKSEKILFSLRTFGNEVNLIVYDQEKYNSGSKIPAVDFVIILYSENSQEDESIYRFIKQIEEQNDFERVLILPQKYQAGSNPFPAVFHTIRFHQHHFLYYDDEFGLLEVETTLNQLISEAIKRKKLSNVNIEQKGKGLAALWGNTKIRTGILLLPVFAAMILVFVRLLPQTLTAFAANESLRNIVSPPTMTGIVLDEKFSPFDNANWSEEHLFRGIRFINVDTDQQSLKLTANESIVEDRYQLTSNQSWSMDSLQAMQIVFSIDAMTPSQAEAGLAFSLINEENPDLKVTCQVKPQNEIGKIECQIVDGNKKVILSNLITFTLGESHVLTMAFIPNRYSFQIFLDDQFYGEIEVPSVEYWRGRNFHVVLESSLSNLMSDSYSAQINSVLLSQQS